ncbi:MAG TPA: cytochrome c oxidase subunit 3, partial [Bryobacteraceae bacterium]|nr:cytochrome c oxidase subunit 3 [Bryobacteraceae bacterium]
LVFLIVSCLGAYLASEAAKKGDRGGMLRGLILNIVLASVAMAIRGVAWHGWNFKWTAGVYGSITWGILFLHTLDTAADMAFTIVLIVLLARGNAGPKQRLGVHVDSVIWYFLVAIWIPLYLAVYWTPHVWSIGR